MRGLRLAAALALLAPLAAQEFGDLQKEISDFTLPNGFHFIVAERHRAPVVAFDTIVIAGSVNDPAGQNGMARLMERMAFKGTEAIGSKNWAAEKQALQQIETLYDALDGARSRPYGDAAAVEELDSKVRDALEKADALSQADDWRAAIAENGGANLGATASFTHMDYRYSLPSNCAEAWFALESQHFLHPVFRDFYKEREAMAAEYKTTDANPQGRLFQDFLAAAFEVQPYRNPVYGWSSTIPQIRLTDAKAFYEKYFAPSNIEIGIAGDITPAEARRLAEKYFGPIPARTSPAAVMTADPPQSGPKSIVVTSNMPLVLVGYKRPNQYDKDDLAFDLLAMALAHDQNGFIYRDLVTAKHLALTVESAPTFPDGRFTNLFVFMVQPAPGHTPDEVLKALESSLAQYERSDADTPDLTRAKARARSLVLGHLETNEELAKILPLYAADYGSWKRIFSVFDQLNKISAADLQRVAARYFNASGRTMASNARSGQ